jgi:hypothetical protein
LALLVISEILSDGFEMNTPAETILIFWWPRKGGYKPPFALIHLGYQLTIKNNNYEKSTT